MHIYTQFEHEFTQTWKLCLHYVQDMFSTNLKTYLHFVWKHIYTMFENMFEGKITQSLFNVWRYVFNIFEDMLKQMGKHAYTIYEDNMNNFLILFFW